MKMFNQKGQSWQWITAIIVVVAIVLVITLWPSGNDGVTETVKIGFMGPLSGDMALYGASSKGGLQLAADDINWTINGKKIDFIYEDSKCDGKAAIEAANKLINVDGVKYIFGFVCSSEILATAPIAESAQVINIGSSTTSPALHTAGEYSFAMYPLDDFESKFEAEFIANKLGKKNIAMLLCLSDWCKGYEKPVKENFESLGGKVLLIEFNEQNAKDLKTQLAKIKNSNPDFLFSVEYTETFQNLVIQAKEIGLNVPIFAPQIITEDTLKTMGKDLEGYYTIKASGTIKDENVFLDRLKQKTGLQNPEIDLTAGRSYDALMMFKQAVESVDSFDTTILKDILLTTKYSGVTGYHEFDKNGVPATASYKIFKVVNSQFDEQD